MEGWQLGISSQSFLDLFKGAVEKLPEQTLSYSNKNSSQAELWESGPSLQQLRRLELNHLCLGQNEKDIEWARARLGEYSPLQPRLWNDGNFQPPREITCEANVLTFVETRYLQRAVCAGLFLCFNAMGQYTAALCPDMDTAYWHDSSSTGTSGRPDRILKYPTTLLGRMRDVGAGDVYSIGCVVEGKTAKVCTSRASAGGPANVLEKLSEYARDWREESKGTDNNEWLKAERTWEVKGKEFLLQVDSCLSDVNI
jgi:hypothetical protein